MSKKIKESTGLASAGVMGSSQPLGIQPKGYKKLKVDKKKVEEMLDGSDDILQEHVAVFVNTASNDEIEMFEIAARLEDFSLMEHIVREQIVRNVVRGRLQELVRKKKDGGAVVYAKNKGGKYKPKVDKEFPSELTAHVYDLKKNPPESDAARKRKENKIEKLRKGKKESTKESIERKILATVLFKEVLSTLESDRPLLEKKGDDSTRWDKMVNRIGRQVLDGDDDFNAWTDKLEAASEKALKKKLRKFAVALGGDVKVKTGEIEKMRNRSYRIPFSITWGQVEVKPLRLEMNGSNFKVDISPEAHGDLSKITDQEVLTKIKSMLFSFKEGPDKPDAGVQRVYDERSAWFDKMSQKIQAFVDKLPPVGLSMLKNLLVDKYRTTRATAQ